MCSARMQFYYYFYFYYYYYYYVRLGEVRLGKVAILIPYHNLLVPGLDVCPPVQEDLDGLQVAFISSTEESG